MTALSTFPGFLISQCTSPWLGGKGKHVRAVTPHAKWKDCGAYVIRTLQLFADRMFGFLQPGLGNVSFSSPGLRYLLFLETFVENTVRIKSDFSTVPASSLFRIIFMSVETHIQSTVWLIT